MTDPAPTAPALPLRTSARIAWYYTRKLIRAVAMRVAVRLVCGR